MLKLVPFVTSTDARWNCPVFDLFPESLTARMLTSPAYGGKPDTGLSHARFLHRALGKAMKTQQKRCIVTSECSKHGRIAGVVESRSETAAYRGDGGNCRQCMMRRDSTRGPRAASSRFRRYPPMSSRQSLPGCQGETSGQDVATGPGCRAPSGDVGRSWVSGFSTSQQPRLPLFY